jgi:glycosyltransferase involved in cell wall biosynthesis
VCEVFLRAAVCQNGHCSQRPALPAGRRVKVLECIFSMGGGGAERQLAYLAEPLLSRGWTVVTALRAGGPNLQRLMKGGAQIEWLKARSNHDPRLVQSIRRIIRAERPDLVHTWLPQVDVIGGFAALTAGVPWVMSERSSEAGYQPNWKDRMRLMLAKRATAIAANSVGGARFWFARLPGAPVHVIANALDLGAIDAAEPAAAEQMGIDRGKRVVLAVGRCSPEKNQRLLIEALPRLGEDVVAVICGDGPLLEETRGLARKLGVEDRVHFLGFVDSVWGWMKRADVFVSVGWFEGHPNAVLEAMAARCPVVVSDIEAHRDVLSGSEALFVDPSSSEQLAAAIQAVLSGSEGRERAERARSQVEKFSIDAAGAAYDALYRSVVTTRP